MGIRNEEIVRGMDTPFADRTFIVRITDMVKSKSTAGNDQIVTDVELVHPEVIESEGKKLQVGGIGGKMYGSLDTSKPLGFAKFLSGLEKAGLDPRVLQKDILGEGDVFEFDKPKCFQPFIGKYFEIVVSCKPRPAMRNPTPAEAKAGVKKQVMKDAQGNDINLGYMLNLDWGQVVGPAKKPEEAAGF